MHRNTTPKSPTVASSSTSNSTTSEEDSKREHRRNIFRVLYSNRLALYQFVAIILAMVMAFIIRAYNNGPITPRQASLLELPGELYIRANRCLALPLMCAGIMSAMSRLQVWRIGYIGIRIVGYVTITTFLAVSMGVLAVIAVSPGLYVDLRDNKTNPPVDYVMQDYITDVLTNLFPDNIGESFIITRATELIPTFNEDGKVKDVEEWVISEKLDDRTNVMGLLCIFIYLGICLGSLDQSFYLIHDLCNSLTEITALCVKKIIWFSPIAFFSSVLTMLLRVQSYDVQFAHWIFSLTYFGVCLIHGLITVPFIFFVGTRQQCFTIYLHSAEALITAFVTASSFTTFPTAFYCMDSKLHLPRKVSLFFMPVGNVFNMDGSAIFSASETVYMAQGLQLPYLNSTKCILLVFASALVSIILPGLPGGLMKPIMNIPFAIFNIPSRHIVMLQDAYWLHNRVNTSMNIMMDIIGVVLVYRLSSHIFEEEPENVVTHDLEVN